LLCCYGRGDWYVPYERVVGGQVFFGDLRRALVLW
jgi:hypothetical protein